MAIIDPKRITRAVLPLIIPVWAVALVTRLSFMFGSIAGFEEYQRLPDREAVGDPVFWVTANVIGSVSLILAAKGKIRSGNALAAATCLIGYLRFMAAQ